MSIVENGLPRHVSEDQDMRHKIIASRRAFESLSAILDTPVRAWADAFTDNGLPLSEQEITAINSQLRVGAYSDAVRKDWLAHERIGQFDILPFRTYFIAQATEGQRAEGMDESIDIIVPIGAYGAEIAYAIAATAVLARRKLLTSPLGEIMDDVDVSHRQLLKTESFKGDQFAYRKPTMNIFNDACLTMGSLGLLFAEKLPSYQSASELLDAIDEQDSLPHIAKSVPVNTIGPLLLSGCYIPGMISDNAGKLDVDRDVRRKFADKKREDVKIASPTVRGWGCPGTHALSQSTDPWLSDFSKAFISRVREFYSKGIPEELAA